MPDKKVTVIDVARQAGVSIGTVDRVLHHRKGVSKKSEERVRQAIRDLGYETNLNASLLASRNKHVIACLIPEHRPGEYWELVLDGYQKAAREQARLGVEYQLYPFNQYDPEAFRKLCRKIIRSCPAGVIMPPFFIYDSREFAEQLHENNIPYVLIDNKIEDEYYLAYFGAPMFESGYLCGYVLTEGCQDLREVAIVRLIRDKEKRSDPTISRREGFISYMREHYPDCTIHNLFIDPNDQEARERQVREFIEAHPEVRHIAMMNSRVHLVSELFYRHHGERLKLVGFDHLKQNIEALKNGSVKILIATHVEKESADAFTLLANYLLTHKEPEKKDHHLHLDILTKYNTNYF